MKGSAAVPVPEGPRHGKSQILPHDQRLRYHAAALICQIIFLSEIDQNG